MWTLSMTVFFISIAFTPPQDLQVNVDKSRQLIERPFQTKGECDGFAQSFVDRARARGDQVMVAWKCERRI
jgi:hypothetical protein